MIRFSCVLAGGMDGVDKALLSRANVGVALRLKIAASAMTGQPSGEIQEAIERLVAVEPRAANMKYVERISAFRQVDLELYVKALRLAGLPE